MKIVDTHMESEVLLIANERSHARPGQAPGHGGREDQSCSGPLTPRAGS